MEDFIKRNTHLVERIRKYESEKRFAHSLRMTELALSYAECYGIDRELTWKTGMLHDIAKGMSTDKMIASAEKYGHTVSQFCLNNPGFMHAEVGALIAEHEFGLKDRDALNAIKYHPTGRPDMSMLEKIIFFSDWTEPGRPNQEALALYCSTAQAEKTGLVSLQHSFCIFWDVQKKISSVTTMLRRCLSGL